MDDYCQPDALADYAPPSNNYRKRDGGNKGDKRGQQERYRKRHPHKYRDYMRRYMTDRRKSLNDSEI